MRFQDGSDSTCDRSRKSARDASMDQYTTRWRRPIFVAPAPRGNGIGDGVEQDRKSKDRKRWNSFCFRVPIKHTDTQDAVAIGKSRTVIPDNADFQYVMLDHEADKRRQRKELKRLMDNFLKRGGQIRHVTMNGEPEPRMKFLNRKQKKNRE